MPNDMMNHFPANVRGGSFEDAASLLRIRSEFYEMPGLKLTLAQASRLFQLDASRCEQVLASMVDTGHLVLQGNTFLRSPA